MSLRKSQSCTKRHRAKRDGVVDRYKVHLRRSDRPGFYFYRTLSSLSVFCMLHSLFIGNRTFRDSTRHIESDRTEYTFIIFQFQIFVLHPHGPVKRIPLVPTSLSVPSPLFRVNFSSVPLRVVTSGSDPVYYPITLLQRIYFNGVNLYFFTSSPILNKHFIYKSLPDS